MKNSFLWMIFKKFEYSGKNLCGCKLVKLQSDMSLKDAASSTERVTKAV